MQNTPYHIEARIERVERRQLVHGALHVVSFVLVTLLSFSAASADDTTTPPGPLPTMATPVAVTTTGPAPVLLPPTESVAPGMAPASSCYVELDRERARVARLRATVARLRGNR